MIDQRVLQVLDLVSFVPVAVVAACGVGEAVTGGLVKGVDVAMIGLVMTTTMAYPLSFTPLRRGATKCLMWTLAGCGMVGPVCGVLHVLRVFGNDEQILDELISTLVTIVLLAIVLVYKSAWRWNEFIWGWGIQANTIYEILTQDLDANVQWDFGTRIRYVHKALIMASLVCDYAFLLFPKRESRYPTTGRDRQ